MASELFSKKFAQSDFRLRSAAVNGRLLPGVQLIFYTEVLEDRALYDEFYFQFNHKTIRNFSDFVLSFEGNFMDFENKITFCGDIKIL